MTFSTLAVPAATFLLDVAVRSLVVCVLAGLTCFLLRHASAAARHALWLLTLGGLLCLPVVCALVPPVSVPAPPIASRFLPAPTVGDGHLSSAPSSPASSAPPTTGQRVSETAQVAPGVQNHPQSEGKSARPVSSGGGSATPVPLPGKVATPLPPSEKVAGTAILIWAVGVAVVLIRTLLGLAAARRRVARCRIVTEGPLLQAAREAQQAMGVTRPVQVREGTAETPVAVPMTWGGWRPEALLPAEAAGWPADRLRAVFLHEIAHVRRGDWGGMLLARVTCALYWFHPVAWLAAQRLRAESEAACDDLVLGCGVPAPDYAAHLLEIVRGLASRRFLWPTTVAIAHRPELTDRLEAILAADTQRGAPPRRKVIGAAAFLVAILVPLAALHPAASARVFLTPGQAVPVLPPARVAAGAPSQGEFTLLGVTRTGPQGTTRPPATLLPPAAVSPLVMARGDGTGLWIGVRDGIGYRTLDTPLDGQRHVYPFGPVLLVVDGTAASYSTGWELPSGSSMLTESLRPYDVRSAFHRTAAGPSAQTTLTLVPRQLSRSFRVAVQPLSATAQPLGPPATLLCQAVGPTALFAHLPTGYSAATKQLRVTVARLGASGSPATWQLTDLPPSIANSKQGLASTVTVGHSPITIRAAAAESPDLSGLSDFQNRHPERPAGGGWFFDQPLNADAHPWTGVPTIRFLLSAHNASEDFLHQNWMIRLNDMTPQWGVSPPPVSPPVIPLGIFPVYNPQSMSPADKGWVTHDWQVGVAYPGQQRWVRVGGEMLRFAYRTETVTFHDAEIVHDAAFGGERVIWHKPQTETTPSGISVTVLNGRIGTRDQHDTTMYGPNLRFDNGTAELLLAWHLPSGFQSTEDHVPLTAMAEAEPPRATGPLAPDWRGSHQSPDWSSLVMPDGTRPRSLQREGAVPLQLSIRPTVFVPPPPQPRREGLVSVSPMVISRHLKTVTFQISIHAQQESHPFRLLVPVRASFPPGWNPDAADGRGTM